MNSKNRDRYLKKACFTAHARRKNVKNVNFSKRSVNSNNFTDIKNPN
jgi:hypothetical protein